MSTIYYLAHQEKGIIIPLTDNKGNPPWWDDPQKCWRQFFEAIDYDITSCIVISDNTAEYKTQPLFSAEQEAEIFRNTVERSTWIDIAEKFYDNA